MTDAEYREAARQFCYKWHGKGNEEQDSRSYWIDITMRIFGAADATDRLEFEKPVYVDGNTKFIDVYIPETNVLIEQKSLGIDLDKKVHQSGGIELTPYEQAKRYNDNLPFDEKARWIVVSNFAEIWIYDMNTKVPEDNVTKINIEDLQSQYSLLDFLLSKKVKKITEEMELSLKAGELVGKIHDRFEEQYNDPLAKKTQNSLNILCVRLVFCLYAEDAGLFGEKDAFTNYIRQYEPKDIRNALLMLFKVLDTPIDARDELYLDEEKAAFPYVNGGLFARENIEIPKITQEIKDTIIESAMFDWRMISPTIFGAVFESTLNPETRRSGGMHYTSIENIHKIIDPLFLDELHAEYEEIMKISVVKTRDQKLHELQDKLASLTFLDPACGSGNYLTQTYISIRRLENDILRELMHGRIMFNIDFMNPVKVSINQFYGIEINDFAVTVAKTALWIAESQMLKETEDIVQLPIDFLPLKTNANIIEGNALQLEWNKIIQKDKLSFLLGNPPFVGMKYQSTEQKKDMAHVFGKWNNYGSLDYVASWYKLAADYMYGTKVRAAFVSTNSISQGEQTEILWKPLNDMGIVINFAYKSFVWESEANSKANVHCVIIGFSYCDSGYKFIYGPNGERYTASNINGYLLDAPNVYVSGRSRPLCNVSILSSGNKPVDGDFLKIEAEDYEMFIQKEPNAKKYIKKLIGGYEFINNKERYVLWLVDCPPHELKQMPLVLERVKKVQEARLAMKDEGAQKLAERPTTFRDTQNPSQYIVIPIVSSQNRRYIPMGFQNGDTIPTNQVQIIAGADIYEFGVLMSNVHMSWVRTVCGRLKSDYRYTAKIVYNNYPWPTPTDEQKAKIERTAQAILDARALYPDSSLADLYDPLTMPPELRKAHQANDSAVMQAYGLDVKKTSEADCVAFLMKMYQDLVASEA